MSEPKPEPGMRPQSDEPVRCRGKYPLSGTDEALDGEGARVRMLSFYFQPAYSGSAVQAFSLTRCLIKRGVTAEVVSANLTNSPSAEDLDGLRIHRLPIIKLKPLQIPSFMVSLAWHLIAKRREFEIVHAHGTYQHALAAAICRALGKKCILKIAMGSSDIAFERQGRIWGRLNRFLVQRFDRYIATSNEIFRECLAQGLESSRVRLIPNGVDVDRFRPADSEDERQRIRRELQLPDGPLVCFVGILDARKNVDGILRIWRTIVRRGIAGHLVLVGPEPRQSDGDLSSFCKQLRRYAVDEGLNESVTFAGRQADVASYLRSADVFLFPSRREGMANVLLEAMASGLACVASAIGGSEDLIDSGKSGKLFSLDDEEGMSDSVADLLRNLGHARELGLAARQTVIDRFSLSATARQYVGLYQELLAERHVHGNARVSDKTQA